MATVPDESIMLSQTIKPTAFAVWCLLCKVKDSRKKTVFLELEKAVEIGVQKSAYYSAFVELESKNWIKIAESKNGKKHWVLLKGFSANVEKVDSENSTNVENEQPPNSANVESDSANAENNSTNAENPIYKDELTQIELTQNETAQKIVETSSTLPTIAVMQVKKEKPVESPEKTFFRTALTAFQKAYAAPTTKGQAIAQNNAISKLFDLARGDTKICFEIHLFQRTEMWRKGRVSWNTVLSDFNTYLANKQNGANNGAIKQSTTIPTTAETIRNRPYYKKGNV